MTAGRTTRDPKTTAYLFLLAVFVWALTTFPCAHLLKVYIHHHMKEPGLHPELVAAYFRTITLTTLALSFLGTLLVWSLSRKLKLENRDALLLGIFSGMLLTSILWTVINPSFRAVASHSLGWGNFLYAGFLAGAIVGEIRFRSLRRESPKPFSPGETKSDFYVVALLTWAVILKVFGCFDLVNIPPGPNVDAVAVHLCMFFSVLLWAPAVCKYLWAYTPSRAIYVILLACVTGVLLPPVVGYVLYVPVVVLLYAGAPPFLYAVSWGTTFMNAVGIWKPVLFLVPGLTWGIIVGLIRWRYLQMDR
jgi:hypothetical protein